MKRTRLALNLSPLLLQTMDESLSSIAAGYLLHLALVLYVPEPEESLTRHFLHRRAKLKLGYQVDFKPIKQVHWHADSSFVKMSIVSIAGNC